MKTTIVTGANRGIGRAICDSILSHPTLESRPLTLYATSRDGSDLGIATRRPEHKIIYPQLDITNPESLAELDRTLTEAEQPVDVLINNAGINLDDDYTPDRAVTTIDVNYRGTLAMCRMILPHCRPGSRIVSLSSGVSALDRYSPDLQRRFREASSMSDVDQLAQEYLTHAKEGMLEKAGWLPNEPYSTSKALVNAMTKVLAQDNKGIETSCCCPGWVQTGMGRVHGLPPPKTVEEGARIPVRLALGDTGGVSGAYWANDHHSDKGEGRVQKWCEGGQAGRGVRW